MPGSERSRWNLRRLFHRHRFMPHGSNPDTDYCISAPGCTKRRPEPPTFISRMWHP